MGWDLNHCRFTNGEWDSHSCEECDKANNQMKRLAAVEQVTPGWRFLSADFSVQALGGREFGRVTLVRDPEQRTKWHALPEDQRDADDGPALYVSGLGKTLSHALQDACTSAEKEGLL